jgi:hypothetical protein
MAQVEGSGTAGLTRTFSETAPKAVWSGESVPGRTDALSAKNTNLVILGELLSSPTKGAGLLSPSFVVVPATLYVPSRCAPLNAITMALYGP